MSERVSFLHEMITMAAKVHGVTVADLQSDLRRGRLPYVRGAIGCVAHETHGYSYPEIGRALNKHHTTILLAVRRFVAKRDAEKNKATIGTGAVVVKMKGMKCQARL